MRISESDAKALIKHHTKPFKGIISIGDTLPNLRHRKLPTPLSKGEETMARDLKANGISFEREFSFHPVRKWRFDFAIFEPRKIAIECDGGTWSNGAHTRGRHFESDTEKHNEATILNWAILRFTTDQISKGVAIDTIMRVMEAI